jgi:hypothetical protein
MIQKRKWYGGHVSFLKYARKYNEEVISTTNPRNMTLF